MVETAATPSKAKATATSKKPSAAPASTKPPTKSTHPATSEMVNAAVDAIEDRKGASLQAIKKYIAGNYVVDVERLSPFIRKYLKVAVEKNILVQTSGVGAAGRFKLPKSEKKSDKPASAASKEKAKKTSTTKSDAAKQSEKPKSPSKAKKSGKAPAAKTKSPKPKTARN